MYLEKVFDDNNFRCTTRLLSVSGLGEMSLIVLVHPTLTQTEIDKTLTVIKQVTTLASKG